MVFLRIDWCADASVGVFIEMFLTALLVFVILMLAAEKHYATHMAPIGIGLTLFTAELAGQQSYSIQLLPSY